VEEPRRESSLSGQKEGKGALNVFDIVGPVMIGPSSSHTAGAARIGSVARQLLQEEPVRAEITLYGSFAQTYRGHGTDRAILGGLLGFEPSDPKLRDSFALAKEAGLVYRFELAKTASIHPNTARLRLTGRQGGSIELLACSVGGGAISVAEINGMGVSFTAQYFTTVIFNEDKPGVVAEVAGVFAAGGINIAFMRLFRKEQSGIMVIETDQEAGPALEEALRQVRHVEKVLMLRPITK